MPRQPVIWNRHSLEGADSLGQKSHDPADDVCIIERIYLTSILSFAHVENADAASSVIGASGGRFTYQWAAVGGGGASTYTQMYARTYIQREGGRVRVKKRKEEKGGEKDETQEKKEAD